MYEETKKRDLQVVMRERLALPTVRRNLEKDFGINPSTPLSNNAIWTWSGWSDDRKLKYAIALFGPINRKRGSKLLESLISKKK